MCERCVCPFLIVSAEMYVPWHVCGGQRTILGFATSIQPHLRRSPPVVYHPLHIPQASCVRNQVLLQRALSNSLPADTTQVITCHCQVWCFSTVSTSCIFSYTTCVPFKGASQHHRSQYLLLCLTLSHIPTLEQPFAPPPLSHHSTLPINLLH